MIRIASILLTVIGLVSPIVSFAQSYTFDFSDSRYQSEPFSLVMNDEFQLAVNPGACNPVPIFRGQFPIEGYNTGQYASATIQVESSPNSSCSGQA